MEKMIFDIKEFVEKFTDFKFKTFVISHYRSNGNFYKLQLHSHGIFSKNDKTFDILKEDIDKYFKIDVKK